jgi:hypothetical protein
MGETIGEQRAVSLSLCCIYAYIFTDVNIKNNTLIQVQAKKEVILSGGSINSPQILMLSGVRGPVIGILSNKHFNFKAIDLAML